MCVQRLSITTYGLYSHRQVVEVGNKQILLKQIVLLYLAKVQYWILIFKLIHFETYNSSLGETYDLVKQVFHNNTLFTAYFKSSLGPCSHCFDTQTGTNSVCKPYSPNPAVCVSQNEEYYCSKRSAVYEGHCPAGKFNFYRRFYDITQEKFKNS